MKYFSIEELCHSDTANKYGIDNTPTNEVKENLVYLIESFLDPIREKYGKPIYINSGYRCKALNSHRTINGAKNSAHLTGLAADLDTRKGTSENKVLFDLIKDNFDFDLLIDEYGMKWVHIGVRKNNRKEILKCVKGNYIKIK